MKAITGFTVTIHDDGTITLSAGDEEAEGHLFAIERQPVAWSQLRAAADALGPNVAAGVEARLYRILDRQRSLADTLEHRVVMAQEARVRLAELEKLL